MGWISLMMSSKLASPLRLGEALAYLALCAGSELRDVETSPCESTRKILLRARVSVMPFATISACDLNTSTNLCELPPRSRTRL